jgi:hypothetical protein
MNLKEKLLLLLLSSLHFVFIYIFLAGSHFHLESALHPKPGSIAVLGYKDQMDAIQSSNLLATC